MVYARLIGQNLAVSDKVFTIDQPVNLLGRGRDCSIVVLDPSVSRMHAKLTAEENGALKLEDLRSSNGSYINNNRIEVEYLSHMDQIRLGNVEFKVEFPPERLMQEKMAEMEAEEQQRGGGFSLKWLFIGLGSLAFLGGVGFLMYYIFVVGAQHAVEWVEQFPKWEESYIAHIEQGKDDYVQARCEEAREHIKTRDFAKAAESLSKAKEIDKDDEEIASVEKKLKREQDAKKLYDQAVQDIADLKLKEGFEGLKAIKKTSSYQADAIKKMNAVKLSKDKYFEDGKEAYDNKEYKRAYYLLKAAQYLAPSDDDVAKWKKKAKKRGKIKDDDDEKDSK